MASLQLDSLRRRTAAVDVSGDQASDQAEAAEWSFPEGGKEAWRCLFGSFALMVPSFGFQAAIGAVHDYIATHQLSSHSQRDIGWISAVMVFLTLLLGVQVGPLFDRYGARYLVLCGSALSFTSYFLLAQCVEYWHFILCLSVCGGIASAVLATVAIAVLSHWFHRRRALASGICMAGSSFGGTTIPIALQKILPRYGWVWSMRILAFTALVFYCVGILLVKGRSPKRETAKSIIDFRVFKTASFTFLAIAVFTFEFIIFGCAALLPTYVRFAGFGEDTQFYTLAVLNGMSFLGRTLPGFAADRIGRFNVLLILVSTTMLMMAVIWLPFGSSSVGTIYAVAALFGFGSGGWLSLAPVCAGQLCRTEEYGRFYGTIYSMAAFGVLLTVPIGGQLLDSTTPTALIGFYASVLLVGFLSTVMSRWALLGWSWKWKVKV
ncbi:hypothetical protein LTR84_008487 [Exophiala bonariae]|uniref:Major facilitator superfamily (MFS) profile domain-containing protein n=1 Tax=Exophiala bonariae TaxID=1690606 RepID=A0AAV9MX91_9EURO|nr:hypothetical protein LTR84_008487 [Exophiala bonariae]